MRSPRLRSLIVLLSLALGPLALAGCGGLPKSLNPFKKEEVKLPGERISVLKSQKGFEVDASLAKKPVVLPAARNNPDWDQPGGVASNAPGHLAFGGGLGIVWSADIGTGSSDEGRLTASPIVYRNKIYSLDIRGVVSAFSTSSGSRLWRVSLAPENERGNEGFGGGMAASGGRIFVTTGFGIVVALNADSGAVEWTRKIGVPLRSSPTAIEGKLFFVSAESKLYSLSTVDGVELWTFRGLPETATLLSNVSPAVAGDLVVVPYPSGEIIAYNIKAKQPAWVDSLSRVRDGSSLASLSDPARPVIDRGIVFAVGHSGRMIATSQKSGERLWTKVVRGTQMPWSAGNLVYVIDINGVLMALTRKEGRVRWLTELPNTSRWSGPVLAGGRLWVVSAEGVMVSVDAKTGSIMSQRDLGTPVFIAPIVASGRMYVLTDKARLLALN
ncbi:outer membrane protein assembly factor BamB precursor [bacterium BMS3Bbin10]|nr:outer membrane protein assembly factor BamB precursor [bacterium BMS3Bbin10]HDL16538.1 pyrrolo-quinoline quinone [Hyphomicrobiales bacterium]